MNFTWTLPLLITACGGISSPVTLDAGEAGSSVDAGVDTGTCVPAPQSGGACTNGQVPCDQVDPCCSQTLVCDSSTQKWRASGISCLLCANFTCGWLTCNGGSVCVQRTSGLPSPDGGSGPSYECVPMPTACDRQWTCDCVTKHLPPNCSLGGSSKCKDPAWQVTVSCLGM